MAPRIKGEEVVRLYFPTINKEFVYRYAHDMERDRREDAYRTFWEQEAPRLFALYGYAPMDVSFEVDGHQVAASKECYQESLWSVFFDEKQQDPWHGRMANFSISLYLYRCQQDSEKCNRKSA